MMAFWNDDPVATLTGHARLLFFEHARRIQIRCDRMFAAIFALQWVTVIGCALVVTPRTWIGTTSHVHVHVWAAVLLGGAILSLPLYLIKTAPGSVATRQSVAVAQMLYSALLIHVTGGRIETHFHIFGSLALLAFYRDWRVLMTATLVTAADHSMRGVFWSESVFGITNAGNFRWVEHAGWVVFEDVFLVMACVQARAEMAEIALRQADSQSAADMARSDQEDLLTTLNAGTIVGMSDGNGIITYVNDRFCQTSGFTREELVGKNYRDFAADMKTRESYRQLARVVGAGGIWVGELCLAASSKGLLDAHGRHRRTVTVQHDITDRKNAEMQLQQAQRLESIGQLAAGIAHEINTPTQYVGDNVRFLEAEFSKLLRVVDIYAAGIDPASPPVSWADRDRQTRAALEELDFDFIRDEIPKAISQSIEGLNRVTSIIRAMKDFSHPGSDHKENADLNRSIASTVEVCRSRWKYVANLELDLAPDLPEVPCLVAEINQVVLNLVVNAADAISEKLGPNSDRMGRIRVSTRSVDGWAEIRVLDDGPGIPETVRRRMFEPFFTTKPVGKGTGQGLALSRNVVTARHGGELFFETPDSGGTVFVVRLPLAGPATAAKAAA